MACLSRVLLIGCTGLALAASLGAGPATQPVDVRRSNVELMPKAAELQLDVQFLQKPLETIPSARVFVPRMPDAGNAMPRARAYVTPRTEWIPKRFNGQTFYIIPCETGATSTVCAPATVNVGNVVAPAKPAAVAPAQSKP
jgi:hypothetical protein